MTKNRKQTNHPQATQGAAQQPWIPMRNAVFIIAATSLAMAGLTAWQVAPARGWVEASLWGLLFGGLIWAIFFGNLLIGRFLRKR